MTLAWAALCVACVALGYWAGLARGRRDGPPPTWSGARTAEERAYAAGWDAATHRREPRSTDLPPENGRSLRFDGPKRRRIDP
jgi:hypothetical protein